MGMPAGYTSGDGITAIMRLRCIGNAWDINVVVAILGMYRLQKDLQPCNQVSHGLSREEALLQNALVLMQSVMGDKDFAEVLANYSKEDQLRFLVLVSKWHEVNPAKRVNACGSILDSGSGRHINNQVTVEDTDDTIPLKGFNNSISWTSGSGTLPLIVEDVLSGKEVLMSVGEVDKVVGNTEPILSLGKLLRKGVDFHFTDEGKCCVAIAPSGNMQFKVELGDDDVLRLPHNIQTMEGQQTSLKGL